MKNIQRKKGMGPHEVEAKVSYQKSDSIGLDRHKLRGAEEEELTLS